MASINEYKIRTKNPSLSLRVAKGHFATSHSHINYYIDVTSQKTCLSEAMAVATELVSHYNQSALVDTVLCLDGTEVIGTCIATKLTRDSYTNINAHQTIRVVTPEHTIGSQLIFRDNMTHAIEGKHVLILAASVTTGYTAQAAVEAITYYGGNVAGICAIFSTADTCMGYPVRSVFSTKHLEDYASYSSHECPLCKAGSRVDALVNSFGFSKI